MVIQGEVVYLGCESSQEGSSHGSNRASEMGAKSRGQGGFQSRYKLEVLQYLVGNRNSRPRLVSGAREYRSDTSKSGESLHVVARTKT